MRVSLEQNNDMMAPYEDDEMPPMDMDDSMDDLGRFSAGSNLSPAPVDGFQDEEEEEEHGVSQESETKKTSKVV